MQCNHPEKQPCEEAMQKIEIRPKGLLQAFLFCFVWLAGLVYGWLTLLFKRQMPLTVINKHDRGLD